MLVGYGIPTLTKIAENKNQITFTYTTEGDGTVPLRSAESAVADKIFYVNLAQLKSDHSQMIGDEKIIGQILKLLQNGVENSIEGLTSERPTEFQETIKID